MVSKEDNIVKLNCIFKAYLRQFVGVYRDVRTPQWVEHHKPIGKDRKMDMQASILLFILAIGK